jgi:pimeloyl-ACP methyl ester carboxylesterase
VTAARGESSKPQESAVTVNGATCRVWQKGEGKPLGFLAGLGGVPRWTEFLDRLAGSRRVVVPSLPGFPGGLGHDKLDDTADWIAMTLDLLEASGLEGADLIGASVGGMLAAEVAAFSHATIGRLVLIAPFGLYEAGDPPADMFAQPAAAVPGFLCARAEAAAEHLAAPEGEDAMEWTVQLARASEAAARLLWPLGDRGLRKRLHRIAAPTLVLWGERDRILPPSYAKRFAAAIGTGSRGGRATVKRIDGAGHLAYLDEPEATARAVLEFV